jgi:pimeloyl-ACP methyl ester carboxylesterase
MRTKSSTWQRRAAVAAVVAASVTPLAGTGTASAQAGPAHQPPAPKPTVVLVHGAWADASSFADVQHRLSAGGYTVLNFDTPLRSLNGDAATLDDFLAAKTTGPVVLVGHSYGGAVVTEAAAADPQVKALVYVDAFVPDRGESVDKLLSSATTVDPTKQFTAVPYSGAVGGDVDLYLQQAAFDGAFANGLPADVQRDLYVAQSPVTASAVNEPAASVSGWRTLPSWYVAGTQDKSIPFALETAMAHRAHSQITTVKTGHLAMIEAPGAVTHVIEQAAATVH